MRVRPFLAAAAIAGVLAVAPTASAADTMRLGGIGSSTARYTDAPATTLQGTQADVDAPIEQAHVVARFAYGITHPYAATRPYYGYYRPYWGGYHRPYWGGYYRPYWGGYYRPHWYGYRNYGYPRPVVYGVSFGVMGVGGNVVAAAAPVSTLQIPAEEPPMAAPVASPTTAERLPTPQQGGTFRYDGGPANPVPMPSGAQPAPTLNEQFPPATSPAVARLAGQTRAKYTYPAYGERLPQPKPATPSASSVLVKSPK